MTIRKISLLAVSAAFILPIAACQTTTNGTTSTAQRVDSALTKAASEASAGGNQQESLAFLERLYKRDSANPQAAVKYATALRENGRLNRASLILAPFVTGDKPAKNADIYTEYATIQDALGNYADAEKYARQAVLMAPESGTAYHALGIALDAQGHHPQAEVAFRKALEYWTGDPVPVLNNLGLNLAAQGFIDEGMETLRKAAAAAPDRTDIERNLRIVSALQSQPHPTRAAPPGTPPPKRKPERTADTSVAPVKTEPPKDKDDAG